MVSMLCHILKKHAQKEHTLLVTLWVCRILLYTTPCRAFADRRCCYHLTLSNEKSTSQQCLCRLKQQQHLCRIFCKVQCCWHDLGVSVTFRVHNDLPIPSKFVGYKSDKLWFVGFIWKESVLWIVRFGSSKLPYHQLWHCYTINLVDAVDLSVWLSHFWIASHPLIQLLINF